MDDQDITFIIIMILLLVVVFSSYELGRKKANNQTNKKLEYILKNKNQTTTTLTQGIRIIISGNSPQEIDKILETSHE